MDFLKSCTTNILDIENPLDIEYAVFESANASADLVTFHALVASLREEGLLCDTVNDNVWIFGPLSSDILHRLESELLHRKERDDNALASSLDVEAGDGRTVREVFIDAVERHIASNLAHHATFTHIGPWRWLYGSAGGIGEESKKTLLRLRAKLTETGSLLLYTTYCSYRCVAALDGSTAQRIILAPSGRVGTLTAQWKTDREHRTSKAYLTGPDPEWKTIVSERLAAEGTLIDSEERWAAVELMDAPVRDPIWWPRRLCIAYESEPKMQSRTTPSGAWRRWFQPSEYQDMEETFESPLRFAEDWFVDAAERERADDGGVEHALDVSDAVGVSPPVTSPPFNQRSADLQAAVFGIYPTPPDGLISAPTMPQHSTSSEGPNESLQAVEMPSFCDSVDVEMSQVESAIGPDGTVAYEPNHADLFGDIGSIEFGANEVGDEDFDYFDEPDDVAKLIDEHEHDTGISPDIVPVEAEPETQQLDPPTTSPMQGTSAPPSPVRRTAIKMDTPGEDIAMNQTIVSRALSPSAASSSLMDPLSPFHIRERLLPPPIPASLQQHRSRGSKRSRTFGPMDFNEGMDFGQKMLYTQYHSAESRITPNSTDKSSTEKSVSRVMPTAMTPRVQRTWFVDSTDEDSEESVLDAGEDTAERLPPALPWESTTRSTRNTIPLLSSSFSPAKIDAMDNYNEQTRSRASLLPAYRHMFQHSGHSTNTSHSLLDQDPPNERIHFDPLDELDALPSILSLFELEKADLISIAQIISEQAVSTGIGTAAAVGTSLSRQASDFDQFTSTVHSLVDSSVTRVFPNADVLPVEKLCLVREGAPRHLPNSRTAITSQQPQSAIRDNALHALPTMFPILAPHIRMQRGSDKWDVLPSALPFWNALGLGPASGSKDLQAMFVLPDAHDLVLLADGFLEDLRQSYESCRMGSFSRVHANGVEDGIASVSSVTYDVSSVIQAYAATCKELGESLAEQSKTFPDRTTIVLLANPFEEEVLARHYLCACFWLLYKAYRDITKVSKRSGTSGDLVLQIIPISSITSPLGMVILGSQQLSALAMEIYDRCPPSEKLIAGVLDSSALPILAAPALQIANLTHRRVGFQPNAEAPSDLLQEGSILHVAYSLSNDGKWVTSCWIGGGGRNQRSMSFALTGKSFEEVAASIWKQTLDILASREVMWRVFVVTTQSLDNSVIECWKRVATSKTRKQMLHVTFLYLDLNPAMHIFPERDTTKLAANATTPGGAFLTPASTPQATFTVSPDASGPANAPLTPAPSEGTLGTAEPDADAYLVDSADEAWGLLLSRSVALRSRESSPEGVAHGLLLRRGNANNERLDALGIDLHWDIRVRPNTVVDDGPSRQIESNMREVLKLYRYLCMLTRLRGLQIPSVDEVSNDKVLMPVHVLCAIQGARALSGMLR